MIARPSTTEVIRYRPPSAFEQVSEDIMAAAIDRGLELHALAMAYATNAWISEVSPAAQGYFDSFKRWFDARVEKVFFCEAEFEHPIFHYTGRPDFIGQLKGEKEAILIDWKTPAAGSKDWRLQIAGYYQLAQANDINVGRAGTLQLRRQGGEAVFKDYPDLLARDFRIFLSALTIWRFYNE